jgi:hypothetical protein
VKSLISVTLQIIEHDMLTNASPKDVAGAATRSVKVDDYGVQVVDSDPDSDSDGY